MRLENGIVKTLFAISILVLIAEFENLTILFAAKTTALTYFYMFLKANKAIN